MDLLGKKTPVSLIEYETASFHVMQRRWLEYECERLSAKYQEYYERRVYFVDDREIEVITTTDRRFILTCYHKHYGHHHQKERHKKMPLGERQSDYRKHLKWDKDGGIIKNLKVVHDETA